MIRTTTSRNASHTLLIAILSLCTIPSFTTSSEARSPGSSVGDQSADTTENGAFVMTVGTDTIGVESFTRSPNSLTGQISGRTLGELTYAAEIGADELVSRWEMHAWAPGQGTDEPPVQIAVITFQDDSVTAEVMMGELRHTRHFSTEAEALPSYPTSIVLLEQITRRTYLIAQAQEDIAPGSALGLSAPITVPLFLLAGGRTVEAEVRPMGGDSVSIVVPPAEAILEVDSVGRILRGAIPAQNLQVERTAIEIGEQIAESTRRLAPEPDYSAPPGAPYTAEEVVVEVGTTHHLGGTLTLPKERSGPVPAVITITGSGQHRRDEDIFPDYAPFRQIADALGRNGVAVLRLDDRGIGASTGDHSSATSEDFADDIRAGIRYLRGREEVDPDLIVLLGHSEGGMIAPMIATTDPRIAGLILMAAPAKRGWEILRDQNYYMATRDTTLTESEVEELIASAEEQLEMQAENAPWLAFFLEYDPLPTAAKISQPVLILQGATDRQVTADQAETLAETIRAGGNDEVEVMVFPDLNHLFVHDRSGDPTGYTRLPSLELGRVVLEAIVVWVDRVSGGS